MANSMIPVAAGIIGSVESVVRYVCCAMFALLIVMLFNFVLARYYSRIAKTENSEILESSMNYYTHSEPQATLEPYGSTQERIGS